jgi:hypothetical protein
MARQVRKQVYIRARQERLLKRLAKQTGATEAEIIRRALDEHFRSQQTTQTRQAAWQRLEALITGLMAQGPAPGGRAWRREDLYDRAG